MTLAKKKTKNKKVYYVSRFRFRYELAEDVRYDRKSPLLYTKDFVGSGSDDESCSYWRQLMALRSKPNWLELRGAFAELKNVAGNMSKTYRGYLLNCHFEPASAREIGRWIGVEEKQAKEILAELEDVGFVELIDLPVFETNDGKLARSKPKKRKRKSPTKRTKAPDKKSGRSRKRTEDSGSARERAGTHGKARAPLEKKDKAKAKANANVNVKGKVDSGNAMREIRKRQTYRHNSLALELQSKCKAKSATNEGPPTVPRDSAERGGARLIEFPAPSPAAFHNRDGPERLGSILGGIKHRFDLDAKRFGGDIYRALKLPWDPSTPQGRRELGCFASLWTKAKASGLPPPVLTELWDRVVDEARKIAKRRGKCSNVSAVFCHVFNRIVAARGMAAGPPRQGVRDG